MNKIYINGEFRYFIRILYIVQSRGKMYFDSVSLRLLERVIVFRLFTSSVLNLDPSSRFFPNCFTVIKGSVSRHRGNRFPFPPLNLGGLS